MSSQLPPKSCIQGANSSSFCAPETAATVAEACDWHHENSKDHPLFVCADERTGELATVPWGLAVQGVYRIARAVQAALGDSSPERPIVGLCSSTDTFTYLLTMLGIIRAGHPVLLLSSRSTSAILSHLIKISGVSAIFFNSEDRDLYSRIKAATVDADREDIIIIDHLAWSGILSKEGYVEAPALKVVKQESPAILLHSSGSTALPRLNVYDNKMVMTAFWQPWYGDRDICGDIMCTAGVPMAGASGVMQALFAASSGLVISGFLPIVPPVVANPDNVWKVILSTKANYAFIFQPFLFIWCQDPEKFKHLCQLKGVIFGGGPLKKDVGDSLAQNGASIISFYGSSEGGLLTHVFPKYPGLDWEYFSFYSLLNPGFRSQGEGTDLYELIIRKSTYHQPTQFNMDHEGLPALATGDVLEAHPIKPGHWKYICRVDDQEILPSGEKINALAFERVIMTDIHIRGAVIFSRGTTFGLLVDPDPAHAKVNLSDQSEMENFKETIMPTIVRYNTLVPQSARLSQSNIIIRSPNKPFTYGEKGLPRRKEAINTHLEEIVKFVGPV